MGAPGDFAQVLDEAIVASGLAMSMVRRELLNAGHTISLATLSYWRSGRSLPGRGESMEALPDLERMLGLPPGTFNVTLQTQPARGKAAASAARAAQKWPIAYGLEVAGMADAEALGLRVEGRLVRESHLDVVRFVGPERALTWSKHSVWRVLVDGVDRFPVLFEPEDDDTRVVVEAAAFCEVAAMHVSYQTRLVIFDMRFPQPLRAGQRVATEIVLGLPDGGAITYPQTTTSFCTGPVTLQLHFEGSPAPCDVMSHWRTSWDSLPRDLTPVRDHDGWFSTTVMGENRVIGYSWDRDRRPLPGLSLVSNGA